MKRAFSILAAVLVLTAFGGIGRALAQEEVELTDAEFVAWKIEHIPLKLRFCQFVEDYLAISGDTLARATVSNDIVIVKSRIAGRGIQQIRYGRPGRKMTVLNSEQVYYVFSESFLNVLLERERYYYTDIKLGN